MEIEIDGDKSLRPFIAVRHFGKALSPSYQTHFGFRRNQRENQKGD